MSNTPSSQAAEAESKFAYFVLAASAASLGYALEHAETPGLTIRYVLFLVAIFAWLMSFYFGLRAAQQRLLSLNRMANTERLQQMLVLARQNMSSNDIQPIEQNFHAEVARVNKNLECDEAHFETYFSWQFRLITLGAIAYTVWRILPLLF